MPLLGRKCYLTDYNTQIQYYASIFDKAHNMLLKCEAFFKRLTDHFIMPTVF